MEYDKEGFFVGLKGYAGLPEDGTTRHFHFSARAVDFLASLQAGDREHGVVLISRRYSDLPAEMPLEVLAADGWPRELYSSSENRVF